MEKVKRIINEPTIEITAIDLIGYPSLIGKDISELQIKIALEDHDFLWIKEACKLVESMHEHDKSLKRLTYFASYVDMHHFRSYLQCLSKKEEWSAKKLNGDEALFEWVSHLPGKLVTIKAGDLLHVAMQYNL